jgi:hypothetical protein
MDLERSEPVTSRHEKSIMNTNPILKVCHSETLSFLRRQESIPILFLLFLASPQKK